MIAEKLDQYRTIVAEALEVSALAYATAQTVAMLHPNACGPALYVDDLGRALGFARSAAHRSGELGVVPPPPVEVLTNGRWRDSAERQAADWLRAATWFRAAVNGHEQDLDAPGSIATLAAVERARVACLRAAELATLHAEAREGRYGHKC